MDKIEKIKEWVKKQKKEELARNSIGVITGKALFVDANELLAFLHTLESEKPMNQDGLEEEILNQWEDYPHDKWPKCPYRDFTNIARHFAEWQKGQMIDEWLKDRDGCFWDGVEEGKKAMEKQMNPSGSSEIPNDLEEAAMEIVIKMHPCLKDCIILGDRVTRGQLMALVKAGAEWQKEQDTRDMFMSDNRHFNKVYELGKKDMKQQMLKDAVEGRIGAAGFHNSIFIKESEWAESLDRLNKGDKVRIVILKAEEE